MERTMETGRELWNGLWKMGGNYRTDCGKWEGIKERTVENGRELWNGL